jgi:hypothetical protein
LFFLPRRLSRRKSARDIFLIPYPLSLQSPVRIARFAEIIFLKSAKVSEGKAAPA